MTSTSITDFKIEKILGKGSFGNVYLVTRKKDKKIYALKTVILEKLNKKEQENSVNEVRILASINHPNVIGYKEAFWNDKESSLNIVMEYADDGDLQTKIQRMRKEGGIFNESLIWSYSIQMIEGLKALHDKKIMHRDLKSANIFLVKENHQCKLGDMNVSKVIKDKVLLTQTGTPYYASPEVWNDNPYSYKSDLWSIGCVIYELCALHPPFNGKDLDELYVNVCKGKVERINKIYSDDLWKMILMLLQVDVKKRVDCDSFLNSKLILKKKKEMKEFNYLENKFEENLNNNNVLLNTIKFSNINEIKAQLPTSKNYNDENINNNVKNSDFNSFNSINISNQITQRVNSNKSTNSINKNTMNKSVPNNSNNNNFIKNISNILSNINNINSNSNSIQHNKNNVNGNSGKNNLSINYLINQSSEREKNIEKKIKNNVNNNNNSKDKKLTKKNYNDIINYHTENEVEKNEKKKKIEKEILLKEIEYNKLLEQLKIQKEIHKIKESENDICQRNFVKEIISVPHASSDLSNKLTNNNNNSSNKKNNNDRIKTEELKTKFVKIKHNSNRGNPIDLIPTSIKKTKTNRLEINKLKNNKSIDKEKNYSYLKLNEPVSTKKSKYGIPIYTSINRENRTKTPLIRDKNNTHFKNDINDNYNYYYYKNYNRLKKKELSEHQKSVGYLRTNPKANITEINDINNTNNYNYKNTKSSKSNSNININLNPSIMESYRIKNKIIKKNIDVYKKIPQYTKIRPSSATSKRVQDYNDKNNNNINDILNSNYIQTTQENKNIHQNISYYYLDNINNNKAKKKIKIIGNNSSTNLIFKDLIPNNKVKNIKHKSTYTNNNNIYYNEKFPTTVDNNDNISQKKLIIDNYNKIKKSGNSYEKNIKKINNKVRHYTYKRSCDEKRIKERKKREILSNRDLTEPELMMILNPIKIKDNYRNSSNKKGLNVSLNDNISPNAFLKQIKLVKGIPNNNPRLNQYYANNTNSSNNNININNIGNNEKSNGPQIYNNFYSINNVGNTKIPVKVINVFN